MTLYEIGENYKKLLEAIESEEIPTEAISDTLDGVQGELNEKADNIACVIKNLEYDVLAIKQEEQNLKDRRSSKENTIERLKTYLSDTLQAVGVNKVETSRNLISFRKSNQFVVYDEEKFMNEYPQFVKIEEKRSIDKKEAKKVADELNFCELVSKQNIQIK